MSAALAHRAHGAAVPRRASASYIAVDKIVGEKKQDLNSINGLNHYIGMKVISPDDIPELRYMP